MAEPHTPDGANVELADGPSAPDDAGRPAGRRRLRDTVAGNILVLVIATVVVLIGVWLVGGAGRPTSAAAPSPTGTGGVSQVTLTGEEAGAAPTVGEKAPAFTTFDTTGEPVVLAELAGKPVWLVFGATWCQNCRAETPDIQAVHEKYGDRVTIVAVYVGETLSTATDYATRLKLSYRQVADADTALGSAYRVMGLPSHVFIDADGVVRAIDVGAITQQTASARLDAMLG